MANHHLKTIKSSKMCDFVYNDIIIVDNKINYMHKMLTYNTTLQSQSRSWKYNIKGGLFPVCIIV